MGELYRNQSTSTLTTSSEFIIYNNGTGQSVFANKEPELQSVQYIISQEELDAFGLEAEPLNISFHGREAFRFIPKKGSKRHLKEIEKKASTVGCVYFIKSCGDHKIGSSNITRIKRRVLGQCPDEILAISKPMKKFRQYEKELHKEFASKRVLKYEIFKNLTQSEIDWIIEQLGGINVDVTQKHSKGRRMANG
tara:strand:+ start:469 stop:1050 length:582 start_codon:yes stop_codon:yes gene_type:complete